MPGMRVLSESGSLGQQITTMLHRAPFRLSLSGGQQEPAFWKPRSVSRSQPVACRVLAPRWKVASLSSSVSIYRGGLRLSTGQHWSQVAQGVGADGQCRRQEYVHLPLPKSHLLQEPFPAHPAL